MNTGYKRKHYEPKPTYQPLTHNDLISLHKLLLKKEYYQLSNINYQQYKNEYYQEKILKLIQYNKQSIWFQERYFKNETFHSKYDEFVNLIGDKVISLDGPEIDFKLLKYSNKNVLVNNIGDNIKIEEIRQFAEKCPGYESFDCALMHHKGQFQRYGIISLKEDTDVNEAIDSLRTINESTMFLEPMVFSNIRINKANMSLHKKDMIHVNKLINMYKKKYGLDFDATKNTIDYNILLLRFVFNHCYYCIKQFDSHVEMAKECGDYHVRTNSSSSRVLFDRKHMVLTQEMNLDSYVDQYAPYSRCFSLNNNREFVCSICTKVFESEVHIKSHIQKRHAEEHEKCLTLDLNDEEKNLLKKNIDTKIILIMTGLEEWIMPPMIKNMEINYTDENCIVYDMKKIFSGEIQFSN